MPNNPGAAILFKNKSGNPKAPVLKGYINVDGTEYELALWRATDRETNQPRVDSNGQGYFTGKIQPKETNGNPVPRTQNTVAPGDDDLF